MSLQGRVLQQLAERSAEASTLAAALSNSGLAEVTAALEGLAWLGLVDAIDPPQPCGPEHRRWFIVPSQRDKALGLIADPRPWPIFEVRVDGYTPIVYTGRTQAKAYYRAYQDYSEHYRCSFWEWLTRSSIRRLDRPPTCDGYDGVRDQYGVDPTIGERRVLINEGRNNGRGVVVLYPNRTHTSMIHCAYDGEDRAMIVHPRNAVTIGDVRWKAWLEAQRAA